MFRAKCFEQFDDAYGPLKMKNFSLVSKNNNVKWKSSTSLSG